MKFQAVVFLLLNTLGLPALLHSAGDKEILTEAPLQQKSTATGETLFERIPAEESGVTMRYELDPDHTLRRLYPFGWATGNVAIGDLDGDGRADLFFPGTTGPNRLFLQRDDFRFEDVTGIAQLGGDGTWGSCAVLGDVDNDGDLDIYIVNFESPNQLFMNISRGGVIRFVDMATDYRIDIKSGALSASFVDYNNDGNLDLYLQTYHTEPEGGRPENVETKVEGNMVTVEKKWEDSYLGYLDAEGEAKWVEAPLADRFFRNTGDGKFFLEPGSNLGQRRSYSTAHTWWDFDHNLRPDLYLGNDSHMPDLLLRNQNGESFHGTSTFVLPYIPWLSRGGVAADFNNDLLVDFLATGSAPRTHLDRLAYGEPFRPDVYRVSQTGGAMQLPRNTLFENNGSNRFRELARLAGVSSTGATQAVLSGDYDGDGFVDLFFTTGSARDWTSLTSSELIGESLQGKTRWDILSGQPERRERDIAFRNLGDWKFEDTGKRWGLDFEGMSYAAGQGDLDGDGDLDIVVCPLGEEVILYRNQSSSNRAVITLEGAKTNHFGVGAELIAMIDDKPILRQLYPSGGFKRSDEPAVFIGMGEKDKIDRLTIRWPGSGAITTLEDLAAGNRYSIREAFSIVPAVLRKVPARPLFTGSNVLAGTGHQELENDDYSVQPFLPPGISRTGPSIAAADLDQDGFTEIAIGGSRGIATRLIARSKRLHGVSAEIAKNAKSTDAGIVFFDANNDGNSDLFVSSGMESRSDKDRDQLYIGGGKGFLPAPEGSLPEATHNSGPVAAADFDGDGDVDLFIGSRFAIGQYPESGIHRLLANDGTGKFSDITASNAPGLEKAGAVSSAIWTDSDGDGSLDLMLTTHWGTIQLWKNRDGSFANATTEAGLASLTGLWNAITGGDIDNDGDIDYLVCNEGLNSARRPPAELFRGDFLDLGTPQLIETVSESDRRLPVLGWLDFAELNPDLLKEYSSSRDFTEKGIPSLFSPDAFQKAKRFAANTLETGYLLNDGAGKFSFQSLPSIAQASTAYGAVLTDVNADGFCDAWILQNRASSSVRRPDPENAGVSQLLLNSGQAANRFVPISPEASGLIIFGAARGAIATDLNNDDRVDFVSTLRNSDPAVFVNQSSSAQAEPLKVRLDGSGKHPAGARVSVNIEGFPSQTCEYYAGGGFLSQSAPELFFAAPKDFVGTARVTIRWADGTTTNRKVVFE